MLRRPAEAALIPPHPRAGFCTCRSPMRENCRKNVLFRGGEGQENETCRQGNARSALAEAFLEDLFVGEPQIGYVGGAEAKDVFQRAANFAKMKINADALE